jgi:hypothetical protein
MVCSFDQWPPVQWPYAITPCAPAREQNALIDIKPNPASAVDAAAAGRAADEPAPRPFPLDGNLIGLFEHRSFGVEERATARKDAAILHINCAKGSRPAGFALHAPSWRYPRRMRSDIVVAGQGIEDFRFHVVPSGQDAPSTTEPAEVRFGTVSLPLQNWSVRGDDIDFVIICPQSASEAVITDIRIVPRPVKRTAGIGTWLWNIRPWLDDPGALARLAQGQGVRSLSIQICIEDDGIAEQAKLLRLLRIVSAAGVAIRAVEGDPEMASPAGRANALKRARLLRRFSERNGLIHSFQYDIEPYLRREFAADSSTAWREWAMTVRELSGTLGQRIDVVVPFWMRESEAGQLACDWVADAISGVTVMAYRTDVGLVEEIAEDWLAWGYDCRVSVALALENGKVPRKYRRPNRPARGANVGFDRSTTPKVEMLNEEVSNSYTKATYSFSHEVEVNPSRISFMGDPCALADARERLTRHLSAWASFGGLLVHGMIIPGG